MKREPVLWLNSVNVDLMNCRGLNSLLGRSPSHIPPFELVLRSLAFVLQQTSVQNGNHDAHSEMPLNWSLWVEFLLLFISFLKRSREEREAENGIEKTFFSSTDRLIE